MTCPAAAARSVFRAIRCAGGVSASLAGPAPRRRPQMPQPRIALIHIRGANVGRRQNNGGGSVRPGAARRTDSDRVSRRSGCPVSHRPPRRCAPIQTGRPDVDRYRPRPLSSDTGRPRRCGPAGPMWTDTDRPVAPLADRQIVSVRLDACLIFTSRETGDGSCKRGHE